MPFSFLKEPRIIDSIDLNGATRNITRLRLFFFSLRDQAINWLDRRPAGSISTWDNLTTRFLAQFFPLGRTAKLRKDILMFQQHQEESLYDEWTRFKDLLQKVPPHGLDLWVFGVDNLALIRGIVKNNNPNGEVLLSSVAARMNKMNGKEISFPLTTVGDLEVLIKDIDASKHKELLSGMTNDKRKVVIEALGAITDDVAALFGVPLNSPKEIDKFTKDLKVGNNALWSNLTKETRSGIINIICNRWDTILNMQKSAPIGDDSLFGKYLPSNPIVQSMNINTKSTSYVRATGASAKYQPIANSNSRPLVADHVFDGVNISIPCKVIEKGFLGFLSFLMDTNSANMGRGIVGNNNPDGKDLLRSVAARMNKMNGMWIPFSLTMVGDMEVLIKDIDASKHEKLLSGMTTDKRKVVIEALGVMCDIIKTQRALNLHNDGLIYSIDDVATLFGLHLNSPKEIDKFTKDLEVGNNALWSKLTKETHNGIIDIICNWWDTLLNMQKSAPIGDDSLSGKDLPSDPIVQSMNINTKSTSYAGAAGASAKYQPTVNSNSCPLVVDHVFDGINISIPRKVVKKVNTRFKHTLYGYFIGKRMVFLVVEYYARNNWKKHGLKRIMMNTKGFFFFKFDSHDGLKDVLEGGPWLICNSLIILKKWSIDTRLRKEELISISIWVKLHDVPLHVFEEDGISLIDTFIGKPVMLDSYTSAMCNDLWGRSSFARCLIEVNSEADLVDAVTIRIPLLTRDSFTKETICVDPPIITTSNVVTPTIVKTNDGFQMVGNKKKRKHKSKSTNGGQFVGPLVKQNVRYEPNAATSEPKKGATNVGNTSKSSSMLKSASTFSKKGNITMSNSYSALENEEEEDEEHVENMYDESANLFPNSKIGESSSFTAAAG
ncbi:zinc knuckle CX2CX4HX4C containing protein [Tanacetum coccineum]